jgi:hypothetical protein
LRFGTIIVLMSMLVEIIFVDFFEMLVIMGCMVVIMGYMVVVLSHRASATVSLTISFM